MNITIFGSGYVGLVTGACLAEVGNEVLCVDIDARKVERLRQGESPIVPQVSTRHALWIGVAQALAIAAQVRKRHPDVWLLPPIRAKG